MTVWLLGAIVDGRIPGDHAQLLASGDLHGIAMDDEALRSRFQGLDLFRRLAGSHWRLGPAMSTRKAIAAFAQICKSERLCRYPTVSYGEKKE